MIVPLQTKGDRQPWYCVHPAGGQVHWYYELSRSMGEKRPFYGIQASALAKKDVGISDQLSTMAAQYVAELREFQPDGPYLLAGWSIGGSIALEMARQLQAAGAEVAMTALIDSLCFPRLQGEFPEKDELNSLLAFAADMTGQQAVSPAIRQAWRQELAAVPEATRASHLLRKLLTSKLLPSGLDANYLIRSLKVYLASSRVGLQTGSSELYRGELGLIRCSDTIAARADGFTLPGDADNFGWQAGCANPIRNHEIPGNHYSIFSKERVGNLAAVLIGLSIGR